LETSAILSTARDRGVQSPRFFGRVAGDRLDETTTRGDVQILIESFAGGATFPINVDQLAAGGEYSTALARTSAYLTHPVFIGIGAKPKCCAISGD
jgi:glycine dehydrogenase